MPVSLEFLRGVLGVIGVGCAFMAGRSLVAVRQGWQKHGALYGWLIRAAVCLSAIVFRHAVDKTAFVLWAMAAALFAAAIWQTSRRKPPEDLAGPDLP